jgi:hypothetical protein
MNSHFSEMKCAVLTMYERFKSKLKQEHRRAMFCLLSIQEVKILVNSYNSSDDMSAVYFQQVDWEFLVLNLEKSKVLGHWEWDCLPVPIM